MEIIPFPNKIFIRPDKQDLGGLEETDSRVSESGVVTHIGTGVEFVKVGDSVRFKAWGADSIEIEGVTYFVMDVNRMNLLCKVATT